MVIVLTLADFYDTRYMILVYFVYAQASSGMGVLRIVPPSVYVAVDSRQSTTAHLGQTPSWTGSARLYDS